MRSNMSLTKLARSSPEGRFVAGAVRWRLDNALTQPPQGGAHPLLRAPGALAGDHVEQLGEVGRPGLRGDGPARGDATGAVPDHARRHRHEARLVEPGDGLDGERVRLVAQQHAVVGHPVGPAGVVGVEAPLQVPEGGGDYPGPRLAVSSITPSSWRTTRGPPRMSCPGPRRCGRPR